MVGLLGTLLALFGLMYLAYRGINVLLLAPIAALFACLFHPGTPLLATYTQIFMPALANYLLQYFPIFILGAIFGKVMNDSGAAYSIAQFITRQLGPHYAIQAIVITCGLLTYGGVSLFVVAFTIYPIAQTLFQQANVPRRLIPAAIGLGSFTFTMTALPGTPSIQNSIPMPVFGTTSFAAPTLGLIAGAVMLGFGLWWLLRRAKQAHANGEGFSNEADDKIEIVAPEKFPSVAVAVLPLLSVLVLNYVFSNLALTHLDVGYLSEPKFGSTTLQKVLGLWSLILALSLSLVMAVALYWRYFRDLRRSVNEGTLGSMLPIFNTASEVGFGSVIASLASFEMIKQALLQIFPQNPLIALSVSVNSLAAITGSASGGLSIALAALGKTFVERGHAAGYSMETLHRVAVIACSGLDALPHNGAVITLFAICGLTHKKSYGDLFMVCGVGTTIANILVVIIASVVPGF
jgi:H+/gluconate symporter-like permease